MTFWLGLFPQRKLPPAHLLPEPTKARAAWRDVRRDALLMQRDLRHGELAKLQERLIESERAKKE